MRPSELANAGNSGNPQSVLDDEDVSLASLGGPSLLAMPSTMRFTKSVMHMAAGGRELLGPEDVRKIKTLGEGAFATVELCRLVANGVNEGEPFLHATPAQP